LNLGLFEHAAGRTKLALRYIHHALYYWDLLVGPGHPDSATADVRIYTKACSNYNYSYLIFYRTMLV
jgi:protein TIF31